MIEMNRANIPLTPWVEKTVGKAHAVVETSSHASDMEIGTDAVALGAAKGSNDSNDNDVLIQRERRPSAVGAPVSTRDVQNVAVALGKVLMNLREQRQIAGSGRVEQQLAQRYASLMARDAGHEADAADMIETYRFFRSMQHALEKLEKLGGRPPVKDDVFTSALYVSRAMKWQFRASAHEVIKETLDNALYERMATMTPGSSKSWSATLNVRGEVVPGAGVGVDLAYESGVSVSPTEWVVDSTQRSASLAGDVELMRFLLANCSAGVTASQADIYASLSDYVASASHKFRTWLNEGPIALLGRIRDLFSLSSAYPSDQARADICRPFLDHHMRKIDGRSIDILTRKPEPAPLEQHNTIAGTVSIGASVDLVVSANVNVAATKLRTTKRTRLDIIDLARTRPEAARSVLRGVVLRHDLKSLTQALVAHVDKSSTAVTSELMTGVKNNAIKAMEMHSRALLQQFVLLQLSQRLTPQEEAHCMALIDEFQRILRPKALATHEINCRQDKWQAALDLSVGFCQELANGGAVQVTYEKVTRDEDPYYCGSFLEIKIAGALNVVGGADEALTLAGVTLGGAWDVTHIVAAIKGGDITYDAGLQTTLRYKLKENGAALLYATTGGATSYRSASRIPFAPVSASLTTTSTSVMAESLVFGSSCLDILLPIARTRLAGTTHGGRPWWDAFTERQRETFDRLFFNIADGAPDSALHADLRNIVREVPSAAPRLERLIACAQRMSDVPTPSRRKKAHDALAELFIAYAKGGYGAEVRGNWVHASDRKRARDEGRDDAVAMPPRRIPRLEPHPLRPALRDPFALAG
ncbi:hypothetical protein PIN31009_00287 [Pandoraea iniqua]|uniref:hypothetical protein n=1 Tax=Pandoraea iniqua TaxID=2508288 RepID=UPI0012419BC1|nr:hypothetical protein [Pandoraea iniqua]VVD64661.1 hypothetical protein PIN31009_00287 [Pandoraea iniqua]